MNKKQPKDSNENQDDVNKSPFSKEGTEPFENSEKIKNDNDLNDRLDDIKKLADDFSMEDGDEVSPFSDESVEGDAKGGDDYLDRLSDIGKENSPFISNGEDEFNDRLDQINQNQAEAVDLGKDDTDQQNESPAFISEVPNEVDQKKEEPLKKQKESIDEIEQDSEKIMSQSQSNEEFVSSINSSFEDDEVFTKSSEEKDDGETVFTTEERELNDSEIIQELENEINNADKATNPFVADQETYESDDFLTNLDKLTIPETDINLTSSEISQEEDYSEDPHQISSSSWKDLMDSTDDENDSDEEQVFNFESEPSFEDILNNVAGKDSASSSDTPLIGTQSDNWNSEEPTTFDDEIIDESASGSEEGQSVDTLRRSFIDEFDQAAQDQENENQSNKKWFPRTIEKLNKWFKSLSLAEKILIFVSFIIGIAVIVSIVLVVTQWSLNNRNVVSPPSAIQATDADLIYPTGLQLPGGWFFFLERGEIVDNRWEPQNAEWLANTKLRRVVAIPWSNQSEEVIRSLTTDDEISIFMNNNDVVVYQVEEVMQISRNNVRILSDTEPSLVVVLFREDNEDRWTVIAKPKPVE